MAVLVLGRPVVRAGAVLREPARRMARIILGVLAVRANRALPLDLLVDALWPDKPPPSAAANVRSHLAELRRVLAEVDPAGPTVVTSRDGYVLVAAPDGVDVARFQRLVADGRDLLARGARQDAARWLNRALALWRGAVMAGVPVPEVIRPDVAALEEQRLCVIEELAEVRIALGEHAGVTSALAGLVVEYPLRERLWRHLVAALAASGRRPEALAVYRRLAQTLEAELGVLPSADTRRLYEHLLDAHD